MPPTPERIFRLNNVQKITRKAPKTNQCRSGARRAPRTWGAVRAAASSKLRRSVSGKRQRKKITHKLPLFCRDLLQLKRW